MTIDVLFVDDDKAVREAQTQTLELAEYSVQPVGSFIEAIDHLSATFQGVVVTDVRMPGKDGFALLERVRRVDPDIPVVMLTGEGDIPMAVRAMGQGAYDFLEKPAKPALLVEVVKRALEKRALVLENRALQARVQAGDAADQLILGQSQPARHLRDQLRALARVPSDVLITGETGVGKELAARVLHQLGPETERPFVPVNCGLLRPEQASYLLFGGAGKPGAISRAAGGVLFLDEVGAIPAESQALLLRFLETRMLDHLDGSAPETVNLRVIAATHEDLRGMMAAGTFRPDLFHRLDVVRLGVPPLRDRRGDIPLLLRHFISEAAMRLQTSHTAPPPDEALLERDWPGNVRELRNLAERIALGLEPAQQATHPDLASQMAQVERTLIAAALRRTEGRVTEACDQLGLPRKTLYDKLKRHGLSPERFRAEDESSL